MYDAICAAAREHGLRWGGHVADSVGLEAALEAGQSTVDHLANVLEGTFSDETRAQFSGGVPPMVLAEQTNLTLLDKVAEGVVASGSAVVPTMALFDTIFSGRPANEVREEREECRYVPAAVVESWTQLYGQYSAGMRGEWGPKIAAARRRELATFHQAGVQLLLGTDSPQRFSVPGFSIHREAALMAECGMSPLEVLQGGTVQVHRYLSLDEPFGASPGARADFVLLRSNPLESKAALADIEAVIHGGRVLQRDEIVRRLNAIAEKHEEGR